jgi:translation initiation factor IF-2
MTKTNVFDTTKQIKHNAEALLNKVKTLSIDIDKHIEAVDNLWSVLDKQKTQENMKTIMVEPVYETIEEPIVERENANKETAQNLQPDDMHKTEFKSQVTEALKIEHQPESEIKSKPEEKSGIDNKTKSEDKPRVEDRHKRSERPTPTNRPKAFDKPQFEDKSAVTQRPKIESEVKPAFPKPREPYKRDTATSSAEAAKTINKQQGDSNPRSFEPRTRPGFKSDLVNTTETTAKGVLPQRDKPFVRPSQQGQSQQQRTDAPRQFVRGKTDRKAVDIVDKFFADPELKERERKDKEEAGKSSVQRSPQIQPKSKTRQDKKDLWLTKESEDVSSIGKIKNNRNKSFERQSRQEQAKPTAERKKSITMGDFIIVKDLSEKIGVQASEIIKSLLKLGVLVTINQELDYDTAMLVSSEFNIELEKKAVKTYEQVMADDDVPDTNDVLSERPPIVTVMGHVDHGKTSLLDAIRNARVTEQEAGGITQHIGAYTVEMHNKQITFLDTPGHEAFTSMRARGAQVTDIAILVVAADDGIMPQTIEAINHAKAAKVPIIVAINKIDLPDADPDRVAQQLMEHGLVAEKWGGETIAVPVSALKKKGIDTLLEMIILVSELQELKANPYRLAKGTVIEAQLDKGRGPVATVLVQNGTLNIGDAIVAGKSYGRVRAMMDYKGNRVKKAGPSIPVEVLGLSDVPEAGDAIYAVKDDKLAKQVAEERESKSRDLLQKSLYKASLEDLFNQVKEGDTKDLNIIIKADVQGSVEAVKNALERIPSDKVKIRAIHGGVGAITESDVMLATASNAIIVGFNVRPSGNASELAQKEKIDIRIYRVIYNAIEDIQAAIKGMLAPEYKENRVGHAEIRAIFKVTGMGNVAGCFVTDGKIVRNAGIRLIRDGIIVHEGKISSLKRFKDDAKEVAAGYECGLTINNFNDIKEGDIIEAYIMEEVQ